MRRALVRERAAGMLLGPETMTLGWEAPAGLLLPLVVSVSELVEVEAWALRPGTKRTARVLRVDHCAVLGREGPGLLLLLVLLAAEPGAGFMSVRIAATVTKSISSASSSIVVEDASLGLSVSSIAGSGRGDSGGAFLDNRMLKGRVKHAR